MRDPGAEGRACHTRESGERVHGAVEGRGQYPERALTSDTRPRNEAERESSVTQWPHNTGPLLTYMASCGNTPCNDFDPTGAKWFKIDELGLKPDGNTWWQQDILGTSPRFCSHCVVADTPLDKGAAYQVTLPQNLAPGGYLIRHEVRDMLKSRARREAD